ncbi:MAG: P-II family nitrogen regulator [Clostridiaceae bacterium]|nr:P-II family nitrogen regulator [Clostridiaceae bacterium]
MVNISESMDIELICVIVNAGLGSKVIHTAKQYGISGGTIALARGTVNNRILDFLGLSDVRKEIVFMAAEKETAYKALEKLDQVYSFHKPNHGIAFTTSICSVMGTKSIKCKNIKGERGADNIMYHAITIIVDKGKGEDVIDAATKAGSKGGTIINARGSGIHETSKVFAMDIEPEKEIVIILSEVEHTEAIVNSIRNELKIDEPGNGIIYVQNVNKTYGIYK